MAVFSRDPREHWLKQHFSKNEVANSGYSSFYGCLTGLRVQADSLSTIAGPYSGGG